MSGIQDPAVYREACKVFGEDGARAWLQLFRRDLAEHLAEIAQGRPTRATIQDIAHRTAGRAGFLGFRALAEASATLDGALRRGAGVAPALDRWIVQARRASEIPPGAPDAPPLPE
ncbi:Hpt domain-containing protein [Roseovarius sp. D22-M7]|uniref:Hpt domain-containing protein n=1 Tax=Roseovarius sp. D22-M7 TaxID=3127116 RepID=UPI0030103F59